VYSADRDVHGFSAPARGEGAGGMRPPAWNPSSGRAKAGPSHSEPRLADHKPPMWSCIVGIGAFQVSQSRSA
jgi:hypothetical protein